METISSLVYDDNSLSYRPASIVMDVNRLGTLYPYPLSFMRCLVRRIMSEQWDIKPVVFDLDASGHGHAIYEVVTPYTTYSYVVFSKFLDPEKRSDRVIAEDWDMTVTLCVGTIDAQRLEFLKANVPLQENGRVDSECIVLSRANKSARNFELVVSALAQGEQPDLDAMAKVGYLYRTTAVYGSGKFGMADWDHVKTTCPDFSQPFCAEMFSCYMIRQFSFDKAYHVAKARNPETAVDMTDTIKRYVGIGNATGLGMAPYLINHPLLIANWIEVRETALARIITHTQPDSRSLGHFECFVLKAMQHLQEIQTENVEQNRINATAREEIALCLEWVKGQTVPLERWNQLTQYAMERFGVETQELLNAILTEIYPEFVLDLETKLNVIEYYDLIPQMKLSTLKTYIETGYDWALSFDFEKDEATGTFWYRSEEKQEPRLGMRNSEPGADKEMMMCIARDVFTCYTDLCDFIDRDGDGSVAHFALKYPYHRYITRRIQTMSQTRYGDIRVNLLDKDVLPIHLLRCKLSFFGVGKFDPRSRMWVRNTMFQGAPLISDIGNPSKDDWCFPIRPDDDTFATH